METNNLKRLIDIFQILRSPQGCPWDREQTHKTLRKNFIEETYEAVDAIDEDNPELLKEELGDVLLQIVFHSQIASEAGEFTIDDVAKGIADKLERRHPHVFGDTKINGVEDVLTNWDEIKKQEKPERTSVMSGVTKSQPALMAAHEISKKAVKVGFEWPDVDTLYECVQSEIEEFKEATQVKTQEDMEEELGDLLFAVVNLARWHKINPELALIRANKKFVNRFKKMEELATKALNEHNFKEYEKLWDMAKKESLGK